MTGIRARSRYQIFSLLVLVGFAALVVPANAANIIFARQDVDNGYYLEGYFAWQDGKGRIVWSRPDSDLPDGGGQPESDVYTSDPLPDTVYLNASRMIEINLFTRGATTPYGSTCDGNGPGHYLGANIHEGQKLVAGVGVGATSMNWGWDPPSKGEFPPDPPGYGTCRIRLAAETLKLEAGTILNVQITHRPTETKHPIYGMGGDHASVLPLPYFSGEEVPYRFPSYAHSIVPNPPGGPSGLAGLLSGLGLGGFTLGLGVARRRGGAALALALLFVSMALGGCMGAVRPGSSANEAEVAQVTPPAVYQAGNESLAGHGGILGQIASSDLGEPVQGAFVAVLKTPHTARSDPYGRFTFRDLPAGPYVLRVDRETYHSLEVRVQVLPDLMARINLTLTPLDPDDPGQRPHLHDYWGNKTERVIMDHHDLGLSCVGDPVPVCQPNTAFMVPSTNDFASVLPGTYDVNVTLDWNPNPGTGCGRAQTVELWFQANNDGGPFNGTKMLARGPRQPFHIATTWEMEDRGHQKFSTWTFFIKPMPDTEGGATNVFGLGGTVDCQRSSINPPSSYTVTITITKGVVPLEPPHADFWEGQDVLSVLRDAVRAAQGRQGPVIGLGPMTWDVAVQPSSIIPPGTTWLEVFANASRTQRVPYDVDLYAKTAEGGPCVTECWQEAQKNQCPRVVDCDTLRERCDVPGFERVGTLRPDDAHLHWWFKVSDKAPDPFYAIRSFWVIALCTPQDTESRAMVAADMAGQNLEFSLTILAHRDAFPPA